MNFVLDTNVIVSALYRHDSKPYEVYDFAFSKNNFVYYTNEIFLEYDRVLNSPKLGYKNEVIQRTLLHITKNAINVKNVNCRCPYKFIDESDRKFYELAKSYDCYLITGNKKHYPNDPIVLTPTEFMNKLHMSA